MAPVLAVLTVRFVYRVNSEFPPVVEASVGAREMLSGMSGVAGSPSKKASGSSAFLWRRLRMRGTWAASWALQSARSSVVEAMASTRPGSITESRRSGRWCRVMVRRASATK